MKQVMVCPSCEKWQVDFTDEALQTYLPAGLVTLREDRTVDASRAIKFFSEMLDAVVREHLAECDPEMLAVAERKARDGG